MNNDNQENLYCEEDGELGVYCDLCDQICIARLYKNHLRSGTNRIILFKKITINIKGNRNCYFPFKSMYVTIFIVE